jgi:hypothetical protein
LYTGYQYNSAQNKELENYITKELVHKEKLGTRAYIKPVAPLLVAEDLIQFMWVCDEYQFAHPRARLQLAFSIVLMTYLGGRPGEIIESAAWKHSNEGRLYGDITLVRFQNEEYVGFFLHVKLRNRKGHRNNKKHSYARIPKRKRLNSKKKQACDASLRRTYASSMSSHTFFGVSISRRSVRGLSVFPRRCSTGTATR